MISWWKNGKRKGRSTLREEKHHPKKEKKKRQSPAVLERGGCLKEGIITQESSR